MTALEALVAAINPTTVAVAVPPELVDAEATDAVLHPGMEQVDVGPFGGVYLRFAAPDLVAAVDAARRLLDEVERVVLDARQDATDAERTCCPWCSTPLEPDEDVCGAPACVRHLDYERRMEAWT